MLLSMGVRVTLVESNEAHCRRLSESLPEALILHGDGTDQELLLSEHFTNNDAFIALTGRDEDNLISALYAQQQGLRKVVAKCNRVNYSSRPPVWTAWWPPSSSPWPGFSGWFGALRIRAAAS